MLMLCMSLLFRCLYSEFKYHLEVQYKIAPWASFLHMHNSILCITFYESWKNHFYFNLEWHFLHFWNYTTAHTKAFLTIRKAPNLTWLSSSESYLQEYFRQSSWTNNSLFKTHKCLLCFGTGAKMYENRFLFSIFICEFHISLKRLQSGSLSSKPFPLKTFPSFWIYWRKRAAF